MVSFFFSILNNDIIKSWVAPIVTGLIVWGITTYIVNILRNKRDKKLINEANHRFVSIILPYIIQKVKLPTTYVNDIRNVIIKESKIAEKYIYSPIDLRNKILMDISESEYINEQDKKELIDFTYDSFEIYEDNTTVKNDKENAINNKKTRIVKISPYILLIFSELMIMIGAIISDKSIKPEDNILIIVPLISALAALSNIVTTLLINTTKSKVLKESDDLKYIYSNYISQKSTISKKIKKTK